MITWLTVEPLSASHAGRMVPWKNSVSGTFRPTKQTFSAPRSYLKKSSMCHVGRNGPVLTGDTVAASGPHASTPGMTFQPLSA